MLLLLLLLVLVRWRLLGPGVCPRGGVVTVSRQVLLGVAEHALAPLRPLRREPGEDLGALMLRQPAPVFASGGGGLGGAVAAVKTERSRGRRWSC